MGLVLKVFYSMVIVLLTNKLLMWVIVPAFVVLEAGRRPVAKAAARHLSSISDSPSETSVFIGAV
jgi:hypothetical protein